MNIKSKKCWAVYRNDKLITHVFFDYDCDEEYVKESLINHDNYPSDIYIVPSVLSCMNK